MPVSGPAPVDRARPLRPQCPHRRAEGCAGQPQRRAHLAGARRPDRGRDRRHRTAAVVCEQRPAGRDAGRCGADLSAPLCGQAGRARRRRHQQRFRLRARHRLAPRRQRGAAGRFPRGCGSRSRLVRRGARRRRRRVDRHRDRSRGRFPRGRSGDLEQRTTRAGGPGRALRRLDAEPASLLSCQGKAAVGRRGRQLPSGRRGCRRRCSRRGGRTVGSRRDAASCG